MSLISSVSFAAHTPDNSFLGFVISRSKVRQNVTKENYALIMGKEAVYLEVIHDTLYSSQLLLVLPKCVLLR